MNKRGRKKSLSVLSAGRGEKRNNVACGPQGSTVVFFIVFRA